MRTESHSGTSTSVLPPTETPRVGADGNLGVVAQPTIPAAAAGAPLTGPGLVFKTLNAYQDSAALAGAIELDLFTTIGAGARTAAEVAHACGAAERGVRILCDYLVVLGFLSKTGVRYDLTPTAAEFLDRRSPRCLAPVTMFLSSPHTLARYNNVAGAVRKGGTVSEEGGLEPDHPMWVDFARGMAPLALIWAELLTALVKHGGWSCDNVLDLAAGHGMYGITLARANPRARVTAVDWANVLGVASENAKAAGVAERVRMLPGSAFDVDYGTGYDLALLTNFLHHFDPPTCETLLRKVYAALAPGGRAVALEFVPNEDRVSPPMAATFSLTMLTGTASGDAYTFSELADMFRAAGFARPELYDLAPTPQRVVMGRK